MIKTVTSCACIVLFTLELVERDGTHTRPTRNANFSRTTRDLHLLKYTEHQFHSHHQVEEFTPFKGTHHPEATRSRVPCGPKVAYRSTRLHRRLPSSSSTWFPHKLWSSRQGSKRAGAMTARVIRICSIAPSTSRRRRSTSTTSRRPWQSG